MLYEIADANDRNSGALLCIGGPYLIYYISPSEEELFLVSFFLLSLDPQSPTFSGFRQFECRGWNGFAWES